MPGDESQYVAFLVRLWRAGHNGESVWHASVDNPHTAERHYFADLEALFTFLEEQTVSSGVRSEDAAAMIQAESTPSAQ